MSLECEYDYTTSYYRCIDPIENFKIRVLLKPVKNQFIPLPQFDVEQPVGNISSFEEECQDQVDEYTFCWQEKIYNRKEIKQSKDSAVKRKQNTKHDNKLSQNINDPNKYPQKLFSYVEADGDLPESVCLKKNSSLKNLNNKSIGNGHIKKLGNVPKSKIVNYHPVKDRRMQSKTHIKKMYIMVDLGCITKNNKEEENYEILCILKYNTSNKLLEMTPSFSKSELKPYIIGANDDDNRNSFYYWLYHASNDISSTCLRKEIGIMTKVLRHQEELKKVLIGTEFFEGEPNTVYVTLLCEIVSAEDFEYDHLYINYFVKLPNGLECSSDESLSGFTQTSSHNSNGVTHFCHLFEINLSASVESFEEQLSVPCEIIFEVLSVDKYSCYRNEGYTYIDIPLKPGMYEYSLRCWRAVNKKIRAQLERFFIGGGPELEDVSYVGLYSNVKPELISRFGFDTIPSGKIHFKLSVMHQSEFYKRKDFDETSLYRTPCGRSDADTLLSSINTVLEAFRKARTRMLEARKGLEPNLSTMTEKLKKN